MLFCRLAFACVCLVIFSGAQVQGQGLEQAERLLLAENPAAARRAAQEIAPATQEEEIQRLWIMALSHMRENAPRAALPYLERLVTLAPETARFRLELGRALYLIEDDTRAGYHFQSALGGVLSFSDIAAVQEYLQAIEQRKLWQGQARVALMRQSNPAQRSGDDALNIVGNLALPLPPVEAATGIEVALGGTYLPPLARDLRARAHVMATGQMFGDKALDRGHLRLEFGLLALGDHGRQIGGGIALQGAFDRDGRLMHGAGLYASFQQSYGRKTHVSLRAGVDRLRYRGVPQMDGLRMTGFAEIAHILSPQLRVQGGLHWARHIARAAHHHRSTGTLSLSGQYAFRGGLIGGLETQLGQSRVAQANPLQLQYGPERSSRFGLTARLMHRDYTLRGFAPVLVLGYEAQTSNVPVNAYDNLRLSVAASRSF
jgi:outer membrane protein